MNFSEFISHVFLTGPPPTFQEMVLFNNPHYPQGEPYNIKINTNNNVKNNNHYLLSIHYVPATVLSTSHFAIINSHSQNSTTK